ncbi:Zinc finger CCCH domain-containing protein [Melia azedarach]|uniref:Zinc finger CCCH domain-containing protein n=2 Tax=Melia azedarach TaxID=155640 RepID=A0ACC1XB96_MELAZ|nr:Zinc finger CCCH domain-containing protein [Melia azedarach]KAJ4708669.1 Zinc finger CCCH domain-containing protein [Melia azedarach]
MEKSQIGTTSFCFPTHRHLKSETYRTLIQILSHCYDHSQISPPPQEPPPEISEHGELVGPASTAPKDSKAEKGAALDESLGAVCIEDRGLGDARMAMDVIEDIMQVEENEDLSKQSLMVGISDEGTGSHDEGFDRQQRLMDELEHIMKGDEVLVQENGISFSNISVGYNQCGVVASMNYREEHADVEQVVTEESRSEAQLQVDRGDCNLDISNSFDSSVNRNIDSQVSKLFEDDEDRNSSLRTNALEVENEMQQKEMEEEKLAHTDGRTGASNYGAEDVEVEEGEISDSFDVDEISVDMISDHAVVSHKKKVSEDVIDKRDFSSNEQNRGTEIFSESSSFHLNVVDHVNSGRAVELKETVRDERQFKPKITADGTAMMAIDADGYNFMPEAGRNKRKAGRDEENIGSFSVSAENSKVNGEIVEQSATQKQGIAYKEKQDSGVCNKKKRSAPSKERKAKKKQKERKRRAEKNRQLGVKRLKLRPIVKPKTVTYCHHYLKGRCHEGEKCKFSHDTVPLTKSTPCCHFARKSCMKGDDCPFDHDLFKYPCSNFVAKGFCNRGDDCLFSHKIPPKKDGSSSSSACLPQLKSPLLLRPSNYLKQPNVDQVSHQNGDVLSNNGEVSSSKNVQRNVAKPVLKPPALAPKGISCLFVGKSSVVESSKLKQGSSSPKRNESGKVANQTEQNAYGTVRNLDETSKRSLAAPEGVNFLSFGNSSLENSSGKKLASLFLNRQNDAKSSQSSTFSVHGAESSAKVGNLATQSVSSSAEKSNDMLKKTQSTVTPQRLNFLSNGNALTNKSLSDKHASLPASSGHSSDLSVHGYYKSTPNSAQKALMSTLAFAAKIESEMKTNLSAVNNGFNSLTRGSGNDGRRSGGSLNDSAKASKIREFLSIVGHETKQ